VKSAIQLPFGNELPENAFGSLWVEKQRERTRSKDVESLRSGQVYISQRDPLTKVAEARPAPNELATDAR